MAIVFLKSGTMQAIADAIRSKLGTTTSYKPGEMADAVNSIETGGSIDLSQYTLVGEGSHDIDVNIESGKKYLAVAKNEAVNTTLSYATTSSESGIIGTLDGSNSLLKAFVFTSPATGVLYADATSNNEFVVYLVENI